MRRWLMIAALTLLVCGCKSTVHPRDARRTEKVPIEQPIGVPNGEASPFGP